MQLPTVVTFSASLRKFTALINVKVFDKKKIKKKFAYEACETMWLLFIVPVKTAVLHVADNGTPTWDPCEE